MAAHYPAQRAHVAGRAWGHGWRKVATQRVRLADYYIWYFRVAEGRYQASLPSDRLACVLITVVNSSRLMVPLPSLSIWLAYRVRSSSIQNKQRTETVDRHQGQRSRRVGTNSVHAALER